MTTGSFALYSALVPVIAMTAAAENAKPQLQYYNVTNYVEM